MTVGVEIKNYTHSLCWPMLGGGGVEKPDGCRISAGYATYGGWIRLVLAGSGGCSWGNLCRITREIKSAAAINLRGAVNWAKNSMSNVETGCYGHY